MAATKQKQLKWTIVDKTICVIINRKKLLFSGTKAELDKLKKQIEAYNKLNSEDKLNKIISGFNAKEEKKKLAKKIEHKKAKKQIKEVKKELKQLKKVTNSKSSTYNSASALPVQHPLIKDKRFKIIEGDVYLVPYTTIPMPTKLVEKLVICVNNNIELTPYINFWKLCLLNSNPIARTKLFDYLERHNLLVTEYGYIVTFRMVKHTTRKTKKGEPIYTSARTGNEDYIIGTAYSMNRSDCDEDGANDCSRGLHTGSPAFIGVQTGVGYGSKESKEKVYTPSYGTGYSRPTDNKGFDSSFGNQAVICLVNPMHVVSIPNSDTRKMRSCELYFCKTTTAEEVAHLTEHDYAVFNNSYHTYEIEQLEKMLKETKLVNYRDDSNRKMLEATRKRKEEELNQLKTKINYNKDGINAQLGIGDIKRIIESRLKLIE